MDMTHKRNVVHIGKCTSFNEIDRKVVPDDPSSDSLLL